MSYANIQQPQAPSSSQSGQQQRSWSFEGQLPSPQPECEPIPNPKAAAKIIELFANERYSPRLGFSPRGLLLTDRGAFSSSDGSLSFSTLSEAEQGLLAMGWSYNGDWIVCIPRSDAGISLSVAGQNEGWLYSADFAGFLTPDSGHATKSLNHFVRRRRLNRQQIFDERTVYANEFQTCRSCDFRRIEQLEPLLRDALWKALHARYGPKEIMRLDKIVKLKKLLVAGLFAKSQTAYSHAFFAQQLEQFVKSQVPSGSTSKFNALPEYNDQSEVGRVIQDAFTVDERKGIVRALIRKFDMSYTYHCADPQCGTECAFAVQRCPNPGCNVRFSRKWWGEHDANCPHKVIACPLQCGRLCVRSQAERHMAEECIMRPVPCPYANVLCRPVGGLIVRDVQQHCATHHPHHLDLTTVAIDKVLGEIQSLRFQQDSIRQRIGSPPPSTWQSNTGSHNSAVIHR